MPSPPFEPIRIGNTVIKRTKESSYTITNAASPHLMKSISAATSSSGGTIDAADVLTLRSYVKRTRHATELYAALGLVRDLGKQLEALISSGRSIACLGVDDVVVITHRASDQFFQNDLDSTLGDSRMDPQFLFLNDHLIFEIDEDTGALIMDHALPPKPSDKFMSPELKHLLKTTTTTTTTPTTARETHLSVHFKTIYYSAAQLVIYFLLNVVDPSPTDLEYLNPIKNTKLYWFLLRCLAPVPAERTYIYI
jgi:hypothetical protein